LKTAVQSILDKNTESKYYDVSDENVQVYHNIGRTGGAVTTIPYSDNTFFNPWADIPQGPGRANRIGDQWIFTIL